MITKDIAIRDRKLLDLAHKLNDCTRCGKYVPEGLEPAHSNQSIHGKGAGRKAHDHWHAALCHECHAELDQGSTMTREEKAWEWAIAHIATWNEYMRRGWLKVAA